MPIIGSHIVGVGTVGEGGTPAPPSDTAKYIEETGAICTVGEQVNDCVYIYASGEVRRANATNIGTAKAIGFIKSKQTDTSCTVIFLGLLSGFTGLIPNKVYFVSLVDGVITDVPPTGVNVTQAKVGVAWNTTTLFVSPSMEYFVKQS